MSRFDDGFVAFLVTGCAGLLLGGIAGFASARDVEHDFDTKDALRAECIKGNDRACRVYEVDYGRE